MNATSGLAELAVVRKRRYTLSFDTLASGERGQSADRLVRVAVRRDASLAPVPSGRDAGWSATATRAAAAAMVSKFGAAFGANLARWIVDSQVEEDFRTLSHDRLADGRMFNQTFGGNRG